MHHAAKEIATRVQAADPQLGEVTFIDAKDLSLGWEDYDQDDFPPNDWDSLFQHYDDLKEQAAEEIFDAVSEYYFGEFDLEAHVTSPRAMARRVIVKNLIVYSNIVENFDPIDIILDLWKNQQERSECESYDVIMK